MNETTRSYFGFDKSGRDILAKLLNDFELALLRGEQPLPEEWVLRIPEQYREVALNELNHINQHHRKRNAREATFSYYETDEEGQKTLATLLDDFNEAWSRGERPRPEEWMLRVPSQYQEVARDELIRIELDHRRRLTGEWLNLDEIKREHPHLKQHFRRLLGERLIHEFTKRGSNASLGRLTVIKQDNRERYILIERLGKGGEADVYVATDIERVDQVAIKVSSRSVPRPGDDAQPFMKQFQLLEKIRNKHILRVLNCGYHGDHPYVVSEYLRGRTLLELFESVRADPQIAATLVKTLAEAIGEVHHLGIVHRDIKPSNIIVRHGSEPVLIDFGLAEITDAWRRLYSDDLTVDLGGTFGYMAPEQLDLQHYVPAPQTDIYGLGGVLHFMATGNPPYEPNGLQSEARIDPALLENSGYPEALIAIAFRALSEDPRERFSSMAEFAKAIHEWIESTRLEQQLDSVGSADKSDVAKDMPVLPHIYNPCEYLLQNANEIVGREAMITEIEAWLERRTVDRVFLVHGNPGLGKTGLMIKLASRHPQCLYHFFASGKQTATPKSCLQNLTTQLLEHCGGLPPGCDPRIIDNFAHQTLPELQNNFIALLQHTVPDTQGSNEQILIILDALDELETLAAKQKEYLLKFLDRPPEGVACVVSSRRAEDPSFKTHQYSQLRIGREQSDQKRAVKLYVDGQLETRAIQRLLHRQKIRIPDFQKELLRKSEGNFMYLRYVFQEMKWKADRVDKNEKTQALDLRELPQGLTDYYKDHWTRLWLHQDPERETLKLLVALTLRGGQMMKARILSIATKLSATVLEKMLRDRWEIFLDEHLLTQRIYRFYHSTYQSFLRDKDSAAQATFEFHDTSYEELAAEIRDNLGDFFGGIF